jgi:hypothetical protein
MSSLRNIAFPEASTRSLRVVWVPFPLSDSRVLFISV